MPGRYGGGGDGCGGGGGCKGGGGEGLSIYTKSTRVPQSSQSVPNAQSLYCEPGPPSSHERSEAYDGLPTQVLAHCEVAGFAKGGCGEGGGGEGGGGGGKGEGGGDGGGDGKTRM